MNGLELQDILLTFPEGGRRRTVLDIPYLKVTSGEHIGIRGASGSGKSSLLNVVSGLVLPDRGTVRWGATVPGALPEHERDRWRGQHIGFVFQDFQLFPELEALELCYKAISEGAAGVDMGRNVFQSEAPAAMIQAVHAVVHDGLKPEQALELFNELKSK